MSEGVGARCLRGAGEHPHGDAMANDVNAREDFASKSREAVLLRQV
jgi:hypothetical protein